MRMRGKTMGAPASKADAKDKPGNDLTPVWANHVLGRFKRACLLLSCSDLEERPSKKRSTPRISGSKSKRWLCLVLSW